jgi:hypothetical protein
MLLFPNLKKKRYNFKIFLNSLIILDIYLKYTFSNVDDKKESLEDESSNSKLAIIYDIECI